MRLLRRYRQALFNAIPADFGEATILIAVAPFITEHTTRAASVVMRNVLTARQEDAAQTAPERLPGRMFRPDALYMSQLCCARTATAEGMMLAPHANRPGRQLCAMAAG